MWSIQLDRLEWHANLVGVQPIRKAPNLFQLMGHCQNKINHRHMSLLKRKRKKYANYLKNIAGQTLRTARRVDTLESA